MTVAVAVRTSTAVVLAADSKLTTKALAGFDGKGEPVFLTQTYDNATKVVRDAAKRAIAVAAGDVGLGPISLMDYLASSEVPTSSVLDEQGARIKEFAEGIAKLRNEYWTQTKVPKEGWPGVSVMLAIASPASPEPLIWRLLFHHGEPAVSRILERPGVWLDGSCNETFSLLYGYHPHTIEALGHETKIDGKPVGVKPLADALGTIAVLKPVDKLSLSVMPDQDAVDLAFFLATVQIQMDRFLPGAALCGGPIDVMVLKTAPNQEILWHPGKVLRHPGSQ